MRSALDHRPSAEHCSLPPELSFLVSDAFPASFLQQVAAEAEKLSVSPERQLIAGGYCPEERYYRALANQVGLRFANVVRLSGTLPVQDLGRCSASLAAEGEPHDYVIAPRGAEIRSLLAMQPLADGFGRVAITHPAALERALRKLNGCGVAGAAADGLATSRPALSARGRPLPSQWAPALFFAFWLCLCWALEPVITVFILNLAVATIVIMQSVLRLAVTPASGVKAMLRKPKQLPNHELPVYTVLVPLYREARMVPGLVRELSQLDYPPAKLDIKILVEACDIETIIAVQRSTPPPHIQFVVCPAGWPRTKPRALNIGLQFARGDLVVVFDAEDRPDRDQLRMAAAAFAMASPRVGCFQARLAIDNSGDSWLARNFALEYAQLFDAVLPGLARLHLPVPLGGTSNHFRREVLRQLEGWDAWNVTEDADFGLRLARAGYRVDVLDSTTWEEAPIKFRPWFRQRTRWLKGWMRLEYVS